MFHLRREPLDADGERIRGEFGLPGASGRDPREPETG